MIRKDLVSRKINTQSIHFPVEAPVLEGVRAIKRKDKIYFNKRGTIPKENHHDVCV